tara:strand:+ start:5288 stop:6652 length:1365 start_codon:yes stop_codon:yes gene_type:complete
MARGFLSGAVVGAVVGIGAAGLASVLADAPPAPDMAVAAPAAGTAPEAGAADGPQTAGDADLATEAGAPKVSEPKADDVAALADADTNAPVRPETGGTSGIDAPATPDAESGVQVQTDAPVLPSPQAALPAQPDADELSISTEPAQPPAPEVAAESGFGTAQPEADSPDAQSSDVVAEPEAPATSESTEDSTAPAPLMEQRVGSLVDRDDPPAAEVTLDETPLAQNPIDAYASDVAVDPDKPMMSVVLIDAGADLSGDTVGLAALRSFPYPLSFAIDANLPDAAERSAAYRAEGLEVLAMVDLPAGATPSDAEVTIAAALNAVPQAIGVLEGTGAGFQADRAVSDQVVSILGSGGYGIVMQSKGLNTAQKLAVRDGVPAATVFRDFDSADQTPTVIRRFLDQAAFRADQEGGVIMLGRVRPDTISALLLWGLQDRAERVALAPVSALLKSQVGE